jgi:hypothetical protein
MSHEFYDNNNNSGQLISPSSGSFNPGFQWMRVIFGGQRAGSSKKGYGIQNHLNIKPPLSAALQVLLEASGVVDAIHDFCEFH